MISGSKRILSTANLPAISLAIALCSLGSSTFQSWNYARNIDSVQRNVLRAENLRTCKDIIDIFFQFRLKSEDANAHLPGAASPQDIRALVYRFGALGTFLANFRDENIRSLYTDLTLSLLALAQEGAALPKADFDARLAQIDQRFAVLNDDCVKSAQSRLL